jgi:hypothetical protein
MMTPERRARVPRGSHWMLSALALGCLVLLPLGAAGCSLPTLLPSGTPTPTPTISSGGKVGPHVVSTTYPTDDLVVTTLVATDAPYHADPTGATEAGSAIQQALDDCHAAGGGVVWLPAGTYRVSLSLSIPPHVTLRGDWRDPDSGSGRYGTVILATVPSGGETDPGLFRISGSAGVNGLTVYYPNQSATNPTSYPYTFEILGSLLDGDGYMAGTVEHVTLLDSYRGISAGAGAVHETHTIRTVRGTALLTGMYLQDSADVSHNEDVSFSSSYWANLDPSLSATRPTQAEIFAWTHAHATGMVMGGLDWDHFVNLSFAGFRVGIDMVPGRRAGMTASLVGITVTNSHIGFHIHGEPADLYPGFGLNIANSSFQAAQEPGSVAVQVTGDNPAGSVLFNNVTLGGGATTALQVTGNVYVQCNTCIFDNWSGPYAVSANRGTLALEGSTFGLPLAAARRGMLLQPGLSSATILGTSLSGDPSFLVSNSSAGTVVRQDSGYLFIKNQQPPYIFHPLPRPSSTRLYDVQAAPYHAHADGTTDDTLAIQRALNDAGQAGGGTVYLPAGVYAVRGHLTVPAGVELRGSDDVLHRAMFLGGAPGTMLLAYEGKGTPQPNLATPFLLLNGDHAGVRGMGIHYPEQPTDSPSHIVAYPWTIQGKGTSVYAFDIAFTNAYQGIDFATYPTDGHYISAVIGYALKTGVQVGKASEGWLEDTTFNINAWARAQGLPNGLDPNNLFSVAAAYSRANERAYVVTSGAQNEHMVDLVVYGSHTGLTVEANAVAQVINIGVDGSLNTVAVKGTGPAGVTLLNVQGCGCDLGGIGLAIGGGTVNIFNTLTLVAYQLAVKITGGSYQIEGAAFHHSFAAISGGTGVLAGVSFQDAGTQVTVSGGGTIANLWGNVGQGGFHASFVNGAPALASGNIPR